MKAQETTVTVLNEKDYQEALNRLSSNDASLKYIDFQIYLTTEQLNEIEDKIQKNDFVGNITWSSLPLTSKEVVQRIENKIVLNNQNYKHHPNDFIHGILSNHIYEDENNIKKGNVKFAFKENNQEYNEHIEIWNDQIKDWEVLEVFNEPKAGRYYGVAYVNETTRQIVLVHRGTTTTLKDLISKKSPWSNNLQGILGGEIVEQQIEAFRVTEKITNYAKDKHYNLSFAGHSLGAWLAEISLYSCHYDFKYYEAKAVTFDNPGSYLAIKGLKPNVHSHKTKVNIKDLDITTYLSAPNFVNVCNPHVLHHAYRLFPKINNADLTDPILDFINKSPSALKNSEVYIAGIFSIFGHSLFPLLATFNPHDGKPIKYEEIFDWPCIKYNPQASKGKSLIKEMFNSILGLKFIPGSEFVESFINSILYETIAKTTIGSFLVVIDQFFSDNITSEQFWSAYKHLENKAEEGYKLKEITSPISQFSLFYEGHYRFEPINLKEDILSPTKNIDICLSRLAGGSVEDLEKIEKLTGIRATQLIKLRQQYNTKVADHGKTIIESSSVPIEELRDQLLRLIEVNPFIKEMLTGPFSIYYYTENYKQTFVYNKIMLGDKTLEPVKNFVGREQIFRNIEQAFSQQGYQYVKINGVPGIGKSSCASEYAKIQQDKGITVRLFDSDKKEKIIEQYKALAKRLGSIEAAQFIDNQPIDIIIDFINARLKSIADKSILFIFDNVENYEDIKEFLKNLPTKVKVIITCRDNKLTENSLKPCYSVNLPIKFTEVEAKEYIQKSLPERTKEQDRDALIKETGLVPYKLSKAIAYLNHKDNQFLTIKEYIKEHANAIKTEIINQETSMLLKIIEKSPKAWEMLQYSTYLDPDFISIEIFKELLKLNSIEVGKCISVLQESSLVETTNKDVQPGVKLHREVQEEIKEYIKIVPQNALIPSEIISNLITALDKLMPAIEKNQSEEWNSAELFYIQVNKILTDGLTNIQEEKKASLYNKLGLYYHHVLYNFNQALNYFDKALSIRKELYKEKYHLDIAESLYNICFSYEVTANYQKLLEDAKLSLKIREILCQGNHVDIANSLSMVSSAYFHLGKFKEALKYEKEALKMSKELYRSDHLDIVRSFNNIGTLYHEIGNDKKGLKYLKEALKIAQKLYPSDHPIIASLYSNVGVAYHYLNNIPKAEIYHEKALEIRKKLYLGNNSTIVSSLNNNIELVSNSDNEELDYSHAPLETRQELYSDNHPNIASVISRIGSTYQYTGDTTVALECHKKALKIRKKLYPGKHPSIASSLSKIGSIHKYKEDDNEALKAYEEALQIRQELYPNNHPSIASSLRQIGSVYKKLNDVNKAIELYKHAYLIRVHTLGVDHPATQKLKHSLEKKAPEFLESNEAREFILQRGNFDAITLQIKTQLQDEVLNKISKETSKGNWTSGYFFDVLSILGDKGVKGYLDKNYLVKQLGELATSENIELAQILCFESINLAIMGKNEKERDFTCAIEFAKKYPELIEKIVKEHPEYFIDGSIVRKCINDPAIIVKLLGVNNTSNSNINFEEAKNTLDNQEKTVEKKLNDQNSEDTFIAKFGMQNNYLPQIKFKIPTAFASKITSISKYIDNSEEMPSTELSMSGYFRDPFSDCEL